MKSLEEIIKEIKKNPKVSAIYLFGSSAKGEEKPISDIDIAVIIKDPDIETEAEIGSLYSDYIDVVLFHRLPLHIQFEVFKYGKEIFVRDADYMFELKLRVMREYLETSWLYKRIKADLLG